MPTEFPKAYEPQKYEDSIYQKWEDSGFFNPDNLPGKRSQPFTMMLPPPNVTGTLHMGHAAMLAIEDVMTRYHRMKGDRTLWLPGTDHAAIATQSKVEKKLLEESGQTRHDLGREKFLQEVDAFAQDSHDTIVGQAKKMGASMDWSREAFTLDKARNRAVNTVFKSMYEEGIIYQGDRIVNWDPKMQSNVSDDEMEYVEEKAPFYYFQYGPFVIGTSRPETKFGDKYVVIHPDDERYKDYQHGDTFEAEWINGKITATIIKDEAGQMDFGTGVMTITPSHSTIDFEVAKRHNLDHQQIIDLDGKLLPIAGEFAGMDIFKARPLIVEKLKSKGLLTKVDENYVHNIATNYRGGGVIEPQIRKQWFVDVNKKVSLKGDGIKGFKTGDQVSLKKLMQTVVQNGQINILPKHFQKTYFHWIDNLRDWCISRQIWYGHRIPVWYKGDEMYCDTTPPDGEGWVQDEDTLDTWFSSGLWTFSTLGWPEKTADMQKFHPTQVLETGYDILFFWVARMILMTTYTLGEIPFETIYLHGLVRDEKGRKMSKSLGNVINPLDMSSQYGADATRLSLLVGGTPGNDLKLSEQKIAGFRNFANKLWNISRFMASKIETPDKSVTWPEPQTLAQKWIYNRLQNIIDETSADLENFNLSTAGERLRDFTWSELADWYLEASKLEETDPKFLNAILNKILKLWHPYMPFVTETIWQKLYGEDQMLMIAPWPETEDEQDTPAINEFETWQKYIVALRDLKANNNVSFTQKITVEVLKDSKLLEQQNYIEGLAKVELKTTTQPSGQEFACVDEKVYLDEKITSAGDKVKAKKKAELEQRATVIQKKLCNEAFVKNAPAEIVEKERGKLEQIQQELEALG